MHWFTSARSAAVAIPALLVYASEAYACPLCFASSAPGVLHAYLVSTFFMLGVGGAVVGAIGLYAARAHSQKVQAEDQTTHTKPSRSMPTAEGDSNRIATAEIAPEKAREKS